MTFIFHSSLDKLKLVQLGFIEFPEAWLIHAFLCHIYALLCINLDSPSSHIPRAEYEEKSSGVENRLRLHLYSNPL